MLATMPITIDGALDEAVWRQRPGASGFVQSEPETGKPATESTDVWVAFSKDSLFIAAYCHDAGGHAPIVSGLRKDFTIGDQDSFEVILDTFGDRRNGFLFATNPAGARADQQVTNEGKDTNASWDAVWFVKAKRVADGWTLEMEIPFRSLRFDVGAASWGINFARHFRRKNEVDYWSPVPRAYSLSRVSLAGRLDGLAGAQPGRNLQIKPYLLGSTVRATGGSGVDRSLNAGVDLKYGLTPALTLDLTARPDFAQAEADEQTVNLTQFSQFFP
ncbi:MAG: hydrolase, partial [Acidobacteria bacterium]